MFVPYIQKEQADRLFDDENAVIAGSGYPQGMAKKVQGGFLVTGEWKYCSGAEFASFFTANSIKDDGEVSSFIFMTEQVEILHDWQAFGLKSTGSHTIRVKDAFVPEERTFDLTRRQNEYDGFIHTFPFIPFSQATFTSVCLGIATHFQQEAEAIASRRFAEGSSHFEKVLMVVQEKGKELEKDRDDFYKEVDLLWADHLIGKPLTLVQEDHFSETCKQAVHHAIGRAGSIIRCLGMEAIMEDSAINKIWRDLNTAGQHAFITPYADKLA